MRGHNQAPPHKSLKTTTEKKRKDYVDYVGVGEGSVDASEPLRGCGPTLPGWGLCPLLRFSQPTPVLWGLCLFRRDLVLDVGCLLFSFCSRIRLCIRILWRWWTTMRWRSLQTLLAVSLGSPKRRRELRVWYVKMVPAVVTDGFIYQIKTL